MGIANIDLNNINLDDNFDEENPNTIILIRLLAYHTKFEKRKELKKESNKELMSVAGHAKRGWNLCVSEYEKKKIDPMFIKDLQNGYWDILPLR